MLGVTFFLISGQNIYLGEERREKALFVRIPLFLIDYFKHFCRIFYTHKLLKNYFKKNKTILLFSESAWCNFFIVDPKTKLLGLMERITMYMINIHDLEESFEFNTGIFQKLKVL